MPLPNTPIRPGFRIHATHSHPRTALLPILVFFALTLAAALHGSQRGPAPAKPKQAAKTTAPKNRVPDSTPAVWTALGPWGGTVLGLAIDPTDTNTVWAATREGLFKTTDGGTNWIDRRPTGTQAAITAVALDPRRPSVVYAATFAEGVYKTLDGGKSWKHIKSDQPEPEYKSIVLDPTSSDTVLVSTEGGNINAGVHRSTDGGLTWSRALSRLPNSARVYALAIDPDNPKDVYAGTFGDGVFKSVYGGGSWKPAKEGLGSELVRALAISKTESGKSIFAATQSGLFESTNGGESWDKVRIQKGRDPLLFALALDKKAPNTLYAGSQNTVYKTTDRGGEWTSLFPDAEFINMNAVAVDPLHSETIWVGTSRDGVLKTTDGGETWTDPNRAFSNLDVRGIATATETATLYAGTINGLYRSVDRGLFTRIGSGLPDDTILALSRHPSDPRTLYAGTHNGVFVSRDGGESWEGPKKGMSRGTTIGRIALDPTSPDTIYAAAWREHELLYKSTDGGLTWTVLKKGLPSGRGDAAASVAVDPKDPGTVYVNSYYGPFKSTNGGETFTEITQGLPQAGGDFGYAIAIDAAAPSTLYVSTFGGKVYKSTDGGATFRPAHCGLPIASVQVLLVDPRVKGTVWCGTLLGLFVSTDGGECWRFVTGDGEGLPIVTLEIDKSRDGAVLAGTQGRSLFRVERPKR